MNTYLMSELNRAVDIFIYIVIGGFLIFAIVNIIALWRQK